MKAMSAEGRMHWLQWKWEPALAVPFAIWHKRMYTASADRPNRRKAEKCVFTSIEYVSVLHFKH